MAYTSSNEYLDALEKILKKNRGTRVNTLYDTDANVPDQLVTADPRVQKRQDVELDPGFIDQVQMDVTPPTPRGQVAGASTQESTQDFLQQLGEFYYSPETQQLMQDPQDQQGQVMDAEGGYLGIDNKFYYEDGTVRESQDPEATPMGSAPNGTGILYSDGSIRRERQEGEYMSVPAQEEYGMQSVANGMYRTNLGNVRQGKISSGTPIKDFNQYLQLLSGGQLSGQDVTGQYGEYYGFPGEAYNIGTDIGTGKLGSNQASIVLPFGAEVLEIGQWDGRNAQSTKTPYGNSVLVRLPTGHMVRFSHLSEVGNLKEGDTVTPGTFIGKTGDTGYAFGKHLDHEMYSPEGQLISSEQFFGTLASQPVLVKQLSASTGMQLGDIVENAPTQTQPNFSNIASTPQSQPDNIFTQTASKINEANPTGDIDFGVTEMLQGKPQESGQQLAKTIEKLNPTGQFDLGISETLAGNPELAQEKRRQTAQTVGDTVATLGQNVGLPEMGFSEFISQIPDMFSNPVYAAEIGKQDKPQQNVFQQALSQAGSGVSALKNVLGTIDENIFKKKDLSKIGQKNMIGEDTGGQISSNMGDMKSTPNDNRDAFFKGGGFETYKDYLNPGITSGYRGALDTNLFKSSFFENPDNVANVFGNTYLGKDATSKYKSYMGTQYPILPGGDSPTIKKSEQYLGSYDGLTVDGEYWRDAFMKKGMDVNSGEGNAFQERERQNQKTWEYEDVNPIYYENQYNQSVLSSIPETLKSTFNFTAPRSGKTSYGGMSSPQGLYQPVVGDESAKPDYSKARSIPQLPSTNVFKPQGVAQSVPTTLGASTNRPSIPKPVPTPNIPKPSAPQPSKPSPNSSYGGKPVYNPPAPQKNYSAPAPNSSYGGKPVYNPPPAQSAPAPKPTPKAAPVPTPAPKPAPKANNQNVFQNLVNYLFGWR